MGGISVVDLKILHLFYQDHKAYNRNNNCNNDQARTNLYLTTKASMCKIIFLKYNTKYIKKQMETGI